MRKALLFLIVHRKSNNNDIQDNGYNKSLSYASWEFEWQSHEPNNSSIHHTFYEYSDLPELSSKKVVDVKRVKKIKIKAAHVRWQSIKSNLCGACAATMPSRLVSLFSNKTPNWFTWHKTNRDCFWKSILFKTPNLVKEREEEGCLIEFWLHIIATEIGVVWFSHDINQKTSKKNKPSERNRARGSVIIIIFF